MKCNDFHELIDSYLCDELLTETNHNVLRHLENCENCRAVIKSRRGLRQHLQSAIINAPQYQIGKNFTHRLTTELKHEALKNSETKMASRFGYGSWIAVVAGLLLTFTFGFLLLNNATNSDEQTLANGHIINNLPTNDLTNIALGDHEFCAVEHSKNEPVVLTQTPVKYEKIDAVVMSPIENVLDGCKLVKSHSCKYKGQTFTHLIVEKDGKHLSIMVTDLKNAEKLTDEDILYLSSDKYQLARFDLKDEAVFIISDFNKEKNSQAARSIFNPLRNHFDKNEFSTVKTSFLTFIK